MKLDITDLNSPESREKLRAAYLEAKTWAAGGYSQSSRDYWTGMRDTLAVLVGVTTAAPMDSTEDAAATKLLGP